jgi:hypothetical protein
MTSIDRLWTVERIQHAILMMRGQRVMLDETLAQLYRVSTKRLNEQVQRNRERFPRDFMFQLTANEAKILRSQSATSRTSHGGRRYAPYAFTEHGAVMLASVLNSRVAVAASVRIVRGFVRLRRLSREYPELARRLRLLERRYDAQFRAVFAAIRELMAPPLRASRLIGFRPPAGGPHARHRASSRGSRLLLGSRPRGNRPRGGCACVE